MGPASQAQPSGTSTPTAHPELNTETDHQSRAGAGGQAPRWIRWLVLVNLTLVGLQSLTAGLFLSGYDHAVHAHAIVAAVLLVGTLAQAVTAVILWRRRRLPGEVAAASLGLLLALLVQVMLGHRQVYWLHVPLGVGLFGGLIRQAARLG
jgi:hypothetical protein